jgi:hypothetical protein
MPIRADKAQRNAWCIGIYQNENKYKYKHNRTVSSEWIVKSEWVMIWQWIGCELRPRKMNGSMSRGKEVLKTNSCHVICSRSHALSDHSPQGNLKPRGVCLRALSLAERIISALLWVQGLCMGVSRRLQDSGCAEVAKKAKIVYWTWIRHEPLRGADPEHVESHRKHVETAARSISPESVIVRIVTRESKYAQKLCYLSLSNWWNWLCANVSNMPPGVATQRARWCRAVGLLVSDKDNVSVRVMPGFA